LVVSLAMVVLDELRDREAEVALCALLRSLRWRT